MRNMLIISLLLISTFVPCLAQEPGLQLYSLRDQFKEQGVQKVFSMIRDWGITYVEQGNMGTHGYTYDEYKSILKEYGLTMVSASATYEELRDDPQIVIERAKSLDVSYVVCFWIPHEDTVFTIHETRQAIEVFNAAGKMLLENGIILVYHPHGYEFSTYNRATLLELMISESEHFDFEMDTYWFANASEDPADWLRKYPKEFRLLHLKDMAKGTKGNKSGTSDVESNVVLGTGMIDIKEVIAVAEKIGIPYMFIEDESSRSEEQVPLSLEYINSR